MNLENKIFKRCKVDYDKLLKYGFSKFAQSYTYEILFMNNEFKAVITISDSQNITGKVYDTETHEEYIPLKYKHSVGFIKEVQYNYQLILEDICKNCFIKIPFIFSQSNRMADFILKKYNDKPLFLWDKFPEYGVFKNKNRWYGIIMNIDYSKIDNQKSGEIEVMNVKIAKENINNIIDNKSVFPAYHMNKKNWVSIILNDTLDDSIIINYIENSYLFTIK